MCGWIGNVRAMRVNSVCACARVGVDVCMRLCRCMADVRMHAGGAVCMYVCMYVRMRACMTD